MILLSPPMSNRETFAPGSSSPSLTTVLYASVLAGWAMMCIWPASQPAQVRAQSGGVRGSPLSPLHCRSLLPQWVEMETHPAAWIFLSDRLLSLRIKAQEG